MDAAATAVAISMPVDLDGNENLPHAATTPYQRGKYPEVVLQEGQRVIETGTVATTEVSAVIDITGDPEHKRTFVSNFFDVSQHKNRIYYFAYVGIILTIVAIILAIVEPVTFPAIGAGSAALVFFMWFGCLIAPNQNISSTYLNGHYEQQLQWSNKKAVFVQNADGTVVKYVVRVGPRKPVARSGGCNIM